MPATAEQVRQSIPSSRLSAWNRYARFSVDSHLTRAGIFLNGFNLRRSEVDLLFGDGVSLAFWLNGTDSAACCAFIGGPFLESRYFGEGVGIAVRRGNDTLRQAFNWALFRLWEKGRFTDLWLRYFPITPF